MWHASPEQSTSKQRGKEEESEANLIPWPLSLTFLWTWWQGQALGTTTCQASRWAACKAAAWEPVMVGDRHHWCMTAFQLDLLFSCVLVHFRKMKYFEWNKAKSIWRQIHFIEQELLSHIVCPPTSPAGCTQSKSSVGAFRQLLAPLSHSPTHRPQISSIVSVGKLFYPSKCRPVVLSWEGIVLAQNNNLLSLEGEKKKKRDLV